MGVVVVVALIGFIISQIVLLYLVVDTRKSNRRLASRLDALEGADRELRDG